MAGGGVEGGRWGRRWGERGGAKNILFLSTQFFFFFFFVHGGCIVVVVSILTAVERCWCSEPAGTSLRSKTPELDRQVPKVTTGEGACQGALSLIPVG